MRSLQNTVQTHFWGEYVLNSMSVISEKDKDAESTDRKRMNDLFEMVDDYIEQA
ncbi:MAG: hypothetical protein PHN80_08335 [Hespellia sp.]|nr:hypothetical protein [Hespellia sp.]